MCNVVVASLFWREVRSLCCEPVKIDKIVTGPVGSVYNVGQKHVFSRRQNC